VILKRLLDVFKDFQTSGIFRLEGEISTEDLSQIAKQHGIAFFLIDGREINNKVQFLKKSALAMSFPDYFGANWDAFEDCLTDMSWHETDGFVILYDNIDTFAQHSPDQFKVALEIFRDTVEFWRNQGKPFYLVLRGHGEQLRELPSIVF
jgi:RNAse (barnase) inhibitor barstar